MGDQESGHRDRTVSATAILASVQSLAGQDPEALGALVVEILWKLAELDQRAYECLIGGAIWRELYAAGVMVGLDQAKRALAQGYTNQAEERVTAIEHWMRALEYLGSREKLELLAAGEQEARPTNPRNTYLM